jgi:O-antigen/teichoic acid export membrane protein
VGSFGVWNFLISVNRYVYLYVPNILISSFMPIAAVGYYALATGLSRQIDSVLSPVSQVIYPAATALHAQGDRFGLERLYHDGSRLMMLVMIPIVLVATFWAEDFYRLWIGEKYLSGTPFHSVALLFQILLISTVTTYISSIAGQTLMGAGRVRIVATALIFGSILSLTFSLILIHPYGLAGVAASFTISSVAVDLIAIPLLLQRILGLSVVDFLSSACVRPVAAGALQAILMVCIRLTGQPGDWLHLLLQGILAGTGSVALVLAVGVTTKERQRFLVQPLRRLWGKERAAAASASS